MRLGLQFYLDIDDKIISKMFYLLTIHILGTFYYILFY